MEYKAVRQAKAAAKAEENNANAMWIEENKMIPSQSFDKDPKDPFSQANFRLFLDENSYNSWVLINLNSPEEAL